MPPTPQCLRIALFALLGAAIARAACVPPDSWWRDWILVLCLFLGASLFTWGRRSWPYLTLAVMGWLTGIYLLKQAGAMMAVLVVPP